MNSKAEEGRFTYKSMRFLQQSSDGQHAICLLLLMVYLRESQVTNVSFLIPRQSIVIHKHSTIPAFFAYLLGFAAGFGV